MLLTSCGVSIQPALADAIISAGIGLVGIIGIVTADKKPKVDEPEKAENQDLAAF
jgi:hypothetical protein